MNKKKVFYKYNPNTLSFERVYPDFKSRILIVLRHLLSGILIGGGGLIIFLYFFGSPQEKALRKENKILRTENEVLGKRIDQSFKVLRAIQERDDYMYRAIYQADPVSPSMRNSGVGSLDRYARLDNVTNPNLIINTAMKMDMLDKQLAIQSKSLDEIHEMILSQKDRIHHTPSIQPVANKDLKRMASGYGMRIDPVYGTIRMHEGMDFTAPVGTHVYATADGVVSSVKVNIGGYGKCIDIDHGYNISTKYAHLDKFLVKEGDKVTRGQVIAEVGDTGKSTGPHLHYEVRIKGVPQNPAYYYHGDLSTEQFQEMLEASANRGQVMD